MIQFVLLFYIILNLISFFAFMKDKSGAKKKLWRIPEKTLFMLSIFGIVGAIAGMRVYHHKTQKPLFATGLYIIAILEISIFLGAILYIIL